MSKQRRTETFADAVARLRAEPPPPPKPVRPGLHGEAWVDPDGVAYALATESLSPSAALELAARGAQVVHDVCGCGGYECRLDWLRAEEVQSLASGPPPVLHATQDGRADLEHWRSDGGADLIVLAVEVTWGDRING